MGLFLRTCWECLLGPGGDKPLGNLAQVVKPLVTIEFCRDFDGKRGCELNDCGKLHVCRHFVKGKCTFGPRCKKPHHFQVTSVLRSEGERGNGLLICFEKVAGLQRVAGL